MHDLEMIIENYKQKRQYECMVAKLQKDAEIYRKYEHSTEVYELLKNIIRYAPQAEMYLEKIFNIYPEYKGNKDISLMDEAASCGAISCMKYLKEKGIEGISKEAFLNAVKNKKTDVVAWSLKQGEGVSALVFEEAVSIAIGEEDYEMLAILVFGVLFWIVDDEKNIHPDKNEIFLKYLDVELTSEIRGFNSCIANLIEEIYSIEKKNEMKQYPFWLYKYIDAPNAIIIVNFMIYLYGELLREKALKSWEALEMHLKEMEKYADFDIKDLDELIKELEIFGDEELGREKQAIIKKEMITILDNWENRLDMKEAITRLELILGKEEIHFPYTFWKSVV